MYLTRAAVFVFCTTFCVIQARHIGNKVRDLLVNLLDEELKDLNTKGIFQHKRIIKGEAVKSSWPWLVSLKMFDAATGEISWHFCGASLLNSRWLLTARHCFGHPSLEGLSGSQLQEVANANIDSFQARLGDKEVQVSAEEVLKNDVAQFLSGLGNLDLKQQEMNELLNWMDWQVDFEKIIIHPGYIHGMKFAVPNDIALIKLAEDVPATPDVVSRISTVNLPEQTDETCWPPAGANCMLKGWGCTEIGGISSDLLQKTNLTIQSGKKCNEIPVEDFLKSSFDTRICAGNMPTEDDIEDLYVEGLEKYPELAQNFTEKTGLDLAKFEGLLGQDPTWEGTGSAGCPGDSGGPLMCEKDGEWVQAGVASWIVGISSGAAKRFPSVFTRVSRYVDWIYETMDSN